MTEQIEKIKHTIEPLRQEIMHHKVYAAIKNIDDLKVFMQYHVYAVWEFMSLLKALQIKLTCTSVPWFPKGLADTRYLINELVVGEESDIDSFGKRKSHFELYIDALKQCGADTSQIEGFINLLQKDGNLKAALTASNTPKEAYEFVDYTYKIIGTEKAFLQSAVFTFGREDLIPGMFLSMVNDIHKNFPESISIFKYYLDRHIEVDGDHHSQLALQMTAHLCGNDQQIWKEAEEATIEALKKRLALWDGAYHQILKSSSHKTNECIRRV
jgi:hypothetical protein